jgi:hypothetical protein
VAPALARYVVRTMPWVTLITGCLAGTALLAVLAFVARNSQWRISEGTVRLTFLAAVAALAFVPRGQFRPLTQATPVPPWLAQAGQIALAVPIVAATCWAQLRIMAYTVPPHALGHRPAVYPLVAQLAGWCAITVAAALCVDRSRYADVGGAIAVPVSFAAIALAWYAPITAKFLIQPPATGDRVTIAWSAIATAALALACVAVRDQWHRYARSAQLRFRRAA